MPPNFPEDVHAKNQEKFTDGLLQGARGQQISRPGKSRTGSKTLLALRCVHTEHETFLLPVALDESAELSPLLLTQRLMTSGSCLLAS